MASTSRPLGLRTPIVTVYWSRSSSPTATERTTLGKRHLPSASRMFCMEDSGLTETDGPAVLFAGQPHDAVAWDDLLPKVQRLDLAPGWGEHPILATSHGLEGAPRG